MSRPHKSAPGPTGTSCLTCKQRHKKCDQRRPVCGRCESGGFECLGYKHNEPDVAQLPPELMTQRAILPDLNVPRLTSNFTRLPTSDRGRVKHVLQPTCSRKESISTLGTPTYKPDQESSQDYQLPGGVKDLGIHLPVQPTHDQVQHVQISSKLYNQIPYTPYHLSKTLLDSSILEDYIMAHWDRMIEWAYFKPVILMSLDGLRTFVISRLRESDFARWIMFIIARVCESLTDGDTSQNHKYELWINQIDQTFKGTPAGNLSVEEVQRRHGDWLQVLLVKTMVSHSLNSYQVLRYATPLFLQTVYSDPTHWSKGGDPTLVPLVEVIVSQRHELSHFTLLDAMTSMAFGLPQQIEYSYALNWDSPPTSQSSYAHCCPVEFQVAFAEINACRDRSPSARQWEDIEHTLLSWQSRPSEYEKDWESWMAVAWLAVQESWRHMLLAYLYISVCGLSSDDPRVESSVRQFFQISKTIRGRESANHRAPLFFQYLMAGICARSEKHRSMARKHLTDASYTKFWLLRTRDFVFVLDDLWHGAAANGRPIKWVDYIYSREKTLPVLF